MSVSSKQDGGNVLMKYLNNNRKPMQRMDGDSDDEGLREYLFYLVVNVMFYVKKNESVVKLSCFAAI